MPRTSEYENCPVIHYQISLTKCIWVRRTSTSKDPLNEGPQEKSLNLNVGTWTLPEPQCRPGSLETRQQVRFSSCIGLSGDFWPWLLPSEESRWPFSLLVYEEFPLKSPSHSYRKKHTYFYVEQNYKDCVSLKFKSPMEKLKGAWVLSWCSAHRTFQPQIIEWACDKNKKTPFFILKAVQAQVTLINEEIKYILKVKYIAKLFRLYPKQVSQPLPQGSTSSPDTSPETFFFLMGPNVAAFALDKLTFTPR